MGCRGQTRLTGAGSMERHCKEQGTQSRQAADLAGRVLVKLAVLQSQHLQGGEGGDGSHGSPSPVQKHDYQQLLQRQGLHCCTGGICGDTHKAVDV